jgi:hypothetical protein
VPISELLNQRITYGTSLRLSTDLPGLPVLRMSNLTADGLDITDVKYLDCDGATAAPLLLHTGDILINRTNSDELVGKAAVFDLPGDWIYASYLLRLDVDRRRVDPRFLVHVLNSPVGRLQVARASRRAIGMANINTTEIGDFLVPLPPLLREQRELLRPLDDAWRDRIEHKRQAAKVQIGINDDLSMALGLTVASSAPVLSYAVSHEQTRSVDRLGVQFFHPERATAMRSVLGASKAAPKMLGDIATFVSDRVEPGEGTMVLGLSAIEPHTGEINPLVDTAASAKRFEAGDVLYGRLRPYLNKVAKMTERGLCSTEFYVLRPRCGVDPTYLAVVLRSPFVVAQARHLSTGNTHPRVAEADANTIVVPVPSARAQREIVSSFEKRWVRAQQLREAASASWELALSAFNDELLKPDA